MTIGVDLSDYPVIELVDLLRLDDPSAIFTGEHVDPDGVLSYLYTVGGWIDGRSVVEPDHLTRSVRGALIGGDVILVQAENRAAADALAIDGLLHTIKLIRDEATRQAIDHSLNQGIQFVTERRPKKS
jgi:hypothetical protein